MADRKRRWGDRRDGRWVREVTGLQCIMSNLMPNRTDCEVCLQDKIDVTELLPYIEHPCGGKQDGLRETLPQPFYPGAPHL